MNTLEIFFHFLWQHVAVWMPKGSNHVYCMHDYPNFTFYGLATEDVVKISKNWDTNDNLTYFLLHMKWFSYLSPIIHTIEWHRGFSNNVYIP